MPVPVPTDCVAGKILNVQNGIVPPTGQNEATFNIFSVLNNATLLPTGQNEAIFKIFSLLNGAVPGSTPANGTNEALFGSSPY